MLHRQDIICVSTMVWDGPWTRKQHFMNLLAHDGHRVIYVNPVDSVLTRLQKGHDFQKLRLSAHLTQRHENLYVLETPDMLPGSRHHGFKLANRINQFFLRRLIAKKAKDLNFDAPILWIYAYNSVHLVGTLDEKMAIYDCVDDMSAYPNANSQYVRALETELVSKVNLVFVTADGLLADKKSLNPNTYLVPNGVDYDLFSKGSTGKLSAPDDIVNLSKPIIGFVGSVAEWIDIDLLSFLSQENPEFEFVIVGPIRTDISATFGVPNIHFLGPKARGVIPNYISYFDVGINIFKVNQLSNSVNPLKVYEYLANGIPVVSVKMPEVEKLRDVVYLADNYKSFNHKLRLALQEDNLSRRSARMQVASNYSWPALLKQILEKISTQIEPAE